MVTHKYVATYSSLSLSTDTPFFFFIYFCSFSFFYQNVLLVHLLLLFSSSLSLSSLSLLLHFISLFIFDTHSCLHPPSLLSLTLLPSFHSSPSLHSSPPKHTFHLNTTQIEPIDPSLSFSSQTTYPTLLSRYLLHPLLIRLHNRQWSQDTAQETANGCTTPLPSHNNNSDTPLTISSRNTSTIPGNPPSTLPQPTITTTQSPTHTQTSFPHQDNHNSTRPLPFTAIITATIAACLHRHTSPPLDRTRPNPTACCRTKCRFLRVPQL